MSVPFEQRASDSPLVERVWRAQSECDSTFTSIAATHWELVVRRDAGKTLCIVRGPESKATQLNFPAGPAWFGITFKVGTFMPHLPPKAVLDLNDAHLPEASNHSFWLNSSTWQFPNFENADTFVNRLVRGGLLVHDRVVDGVLQGQPHELSLRSLQYRFVQATGLTHKSIEQIERAHHAMTLLQQGTSILDTVDAAGYFDQPHLTRALKHFIGQTPTQITCTPQP